MDVEAGAAGAVRGQVPPAVTAFLSARTAATRVFPLDSHGRHNTARVSPRLGVEARLGQGAAPGSARSLLCYQEGHAPGYGPSARREGPPPPVAVGQEARASWGWGGR